MRMTKAISIKMTPITTKATPAAVLALLAPVAPVPPVMAAPFEAGAVVEEVGEVVGEFVEGQPELVGQSKV